MKFNLQLFAVPFRRTSKTKKRMRRTHLKKEVGALAVCPKCGANLRPHRACAKCGYYKNEDVLHVKKEEE
ncbi:TPA: 50S ribosomal protein L32 [Candidatus Ventrenecus stercoripullorum]|mgnify:FL=1|nr:50S ribosomal protein L32 [Candidatus Ventrenecus stercoripullorum]